MEILILDHEPYRSQSLARGLRVMGYHVFEAGTLPEAVECLRCPDISIQLMITDCSIQMLYHPELIEVVSEKLHNIQCVMMTDNPKSNTAASSAWLWPIHFIQKPFTVVQLVYLITRLRSQSLKIVIPELTNSMADRMDSNPSRSLMLRPSC